MGFHVSDNVLDDARGAQPRVNGNPHRGPNRGVESGFRFYNPTLGRWLNRDPLGDKASFGPSRVSVAIIWAQLRISPNLYGFVENRPVGAWDYLGLTSDCCGDQPNPNNYECCGGQLIQEFGYGGKSCCGDEEDGNIFVDNLDCCYKSDPPMLGKSKAREQCDYGGDLIACLSDCLDEPTLNPWSLAGCFAWCVTPVCCL